MVFLSSSVQSAQKTASVIRNLEWSGVTLEKIKTDLTAVVQDYQLADTNSLISAIESAKHRLTSLRIAATATEPDSGDLAKASEFAKNIAGLAQLVLGRIEDLDGKQETCRALIADNPSLANTDIGKRFDEAIQSLAGSLVSQSECQLKEETIEAGEAENEWNLQTLRCDQLIEEGTAEAAHLAKKEELKKSISEAGKAISLSPLESAHEQVRAALRQRQEAAVQKQKLANQINHLNLQTQLLDDNSGKLDQTTDQANEAYEQAQENIQEAVDK